MDPALQSALRPMMLNSPGAAAISLEIAAMKAELESIANVATGYKTVEADLGRLADDFPRDTLVRSCSFVVVLRKPHFDCVFVDCGTLQLD